MTDTGSDDHRKLSDHSFVRARPCRRAHRDSPAVTQSAAQPRGHPGRLAPFAFGSGGDNPLCCDPDYAAKTRWGKLGAPPTFQYTMGENATPPPMPEIKALLRGDAWAGLDSYQARMGFGWWQPFNKGDRVKKMRSVVGVLNKPGSFGGRTAHETTSIPFVNEGGAPIIVQREMWINAELQTSKKRKRDGRLLSADG